MPVHHVLGLDFPQSRRHRADSCAEWANMLVCGKRSVSTGMALKSFIYLSRLKVDMLFDQLPEARLSRLATEFKGDLKVVGMSQTQEKTFESRAARLELVLSALDEDGEIGNLDNPLNYVTGELAMAWGLVEPGERNKRPEGTAASREFVMFAGTPDGRRVIGLIGSRAHLMGQEGESVYAAYTSPSTLRRIAEGMRGDEAVPTDNAGEHEVFAAAGTAHQMALEYPAADKQRVEFVARTYRLDDRGVLLGSPLYVALADDYPPSDGRPSARAASVDGMSEARNRWRFWRYRRPLP
jgi:hypothetical protein